jgi:glycine/D-amino acid oxidase-like deaminating enzyme
MGLTEDVPATSDVVVIGGGIVGVAIARALARAGRRTLLIEQGAFGGAVSGASLACLSMHTNEMEELPSVIRSCHLWREASEELGDAFEYRPQGELRFILAEADIPLAREWIARERNHGVTTEFLDAVEVRRVEPHLTGPIAGATWSPEDATVNPFLAVRAFLGDALRHGLSALSGTRVVGIETTDRRVTAVATDRGRVATPAVVIAAGPWTARIAGFAGVELPILPRQAQCLASTRQEPMINSVVGASRSARGVEEGYTQIQQALSGQILFNTVAGGTVGRDGDQDHTPEVDGCFVRGSIATLLMLFPSLAGIQLMRSWVRFEAVTPDARFLAGRTEVDGLLVAAGDNGSGFCRAPMLAELVRDSLDAPQPSRERSFYDPLRLAKPA